MLNKERSNQTAMLKYGLIAPLFMLMIVVSSATLASKELAKIESKVEGFYEANLEEVIVKPSKTVTETLLEDNIDLSKALIISPDLVDEVRASQEDKRDTIKSNKRSSEVFDAVDENPEFIGGMEALGKFLQENLKYPASAQRANVSGKVYIQFIVNVDGTASDFVVLKSAGYGFDEEALRVLNVVPKWIPGKQSGRVVRCRFIVPINFTLEEEKISTSVFAIPDNGKFVMKNKPKLDSISMENPLYIVDGMARYDVENVNKIDPKTIESISMFKGEKAIMRYGDKGKHGVIVITSKKK